MSAVTPLASKDPARALDVLKTALTTAATASLACSRDNLLDATGSNLDHLVGVLAQAHELLGYAKQVLSEAERAALVLLPDYGTRAFPGVGTVERRSGTERKNWDHDRVRSLVVTKAVDNLTDDNGEVRRNPSTIAQAVADALAECGHVDYWRTGKLKEYGVNPDAVCDVTKGADHLSFKPASRGVTHA